jgi:IPT/TIG domain-containing protein
MARRALYVLCALCAALCLAPGSAAAKKKKPSVPKVTKVSPMNAKVGDTLTIRGRGFSPKRGKNTVIFKSASGKSVFVKPIRASRKKLVVIVPAALERAMATDARGRTIATRFVVRVLARRFGKFTRRARSPVIAPAARPAPPNRGSTTTIGGGGGGSVGGGGGGSAQAAAAPADCDKDGTPDASDSDDDNDFLTDVTEGQIHTDRCKKDTDGDGVEDGFEYFSAIELNSNNLPYPGKRPYPNPLDPSDTAFDFDGDGMALGEESAAWVKTGRPAQLTYNDGRQVTGPPQAPPGGQAYLDLNGDGVLSDDEKDVDGDGIGNWDEIRGRMEIGKWPSYISEPSTVFLQPNFLESDTDGDGVNDGNDDQDHDDVSNLTEMLSVAPDTPSYTPGADPNDYHPYDPCLPDPASRTCTLH